MHQEPTFGNRAGVCRTVPVRGPRRAIRVFAEFVKRLARHLQQHMSVCGYGDAIIARGSHRLWLGGAVFFQNSEARLYPFVTFLEIHTDFREFSASVTHNSLSAVLLKVCLMQMDARAAVEHYWAVNCGSAFLAILSKYMIIG